MAAKGITATLSMVTVTGNTHGTGGPMLGIEVVTTVGDEAIITDGVTGITDGAMRTARDIAVM